jgi:hypothetical protein
MTSEIRLTIIRYPQQYPVQDAVVSFTTFLRLTNGNLKSVEEIPVKSLLIKLVEGITDEQMDQVKQELERAISLGSLLTDLPAEEYLYNSIYSAYMVATNYDFGITDK